MNKEENSPIIDQESKRFNLLKLTEERFNAIVFDRLGADFKIIKEDPPDENNIQTSYIFTNKTLTERIVLQRKIDLSPKRADGSVIPTPEGEPFSLFILQLNSESEILEELKNLKNIASH